MADTKTSYWCEAIDDARDTVRNYLDSIIERLREYGEADDDLFNDYAGGDQYHHENHVDKAYSLAEAAEILEQLSEFEETDEGLWEGLDPRAAVSCQAAYTYGNAVMGAWQRAIERINEDYEEGILKDMMGEDDPASDAEVRARVLQLAADED